MHQLPDLRVSLSAAFHQLALESVDSLEPGLDLFEAFVGFTLQAQQVPFVGLVLVLQDLLLILSEGLQTPLVRFSLILESLLLRLSEGLQREIVLGVEIGLVLFKVSLHDVRDRGPYKPPDSDTADQSGAKILHQAVCVHGLCLQIPIPQGGPVSAIQASSYL